jgi:hypothetical protein
MSCRAVPVAPVVAVVAAAAVASAMAVLQASPGIGSPQAADAMEKFLARPGSIRQYLASRRLEASGGGQRGWMDVQTSFTAASGLHYDVTAEGGSAYIRGRVLRRLLDEERHLIAQGLTAGVAISKDNYQFEPEDIDGHGLAVVRLQPRRTERALVRGRMFLTRNDGDLVRVEGTLAKSPSFWVTRTDVVRSYERIEGVVMPVALESRAQLRLFGSSVLRMTYRYSHIDERPVSGSWDAQ